MAKTVKIPQRKGNWTRNRLRAQLELKNKFLNSIGYNHPLTEQTLREISELTARLYA